MLQVYRGESNECRVTDLSQDSVYQFRVQAVRTIHPRAFEAPSPGAVKPIKGIAQVSAHNQQEIKVTITDIVKNYTSNSIFQAFIKNVPIP